MATIRPKIIKTRKGLEVKLRSPNPFRDADQVLHLARSSMAESEFQITEADEFTMTRELEEQWLSELNSKDSSVIVLAEHDGKIIGMIDFHGNDKRRRLSHTGGFGMSVLKEFRDQGIGSILIQELLEWATRHPKIEKVKLAVLSSNERAIHLYKKLGFIEEGRGYKNIKLGPGKYVDDIWMYRWVK